MSAKSLLIGLGAAAVIVVGVAAYLTLARDTTAPTTPSAAPPVTAPPAPSPEPKS